MAFDFVSLVPAGDDPMAQVVISKIDPTLSHDKENNDMGVQINKSDLDPEVVAYIDELEAEVADLSTALLDSEDFIDGLSEDALLAKADPAVAALIKSQKAALEEAEKIAKTERDIRLDREFISKAAALPNISTNPDELGGLLRRVTEAVSAEDAAAIEGILKSANEQIAKGLLFNEYGRYGAPYTTDASVVAKAEELRKADPSLTPEQAQAKVYAENPDLAAEALSKEEV